MCVSGDLLYNNNNNNNSKLNRLIDCYDLCRDDDSLSPCCLKMFPCY